MANISSMDIDLKNHTKLSHSIISPTLIWCFLMPSIHLFSLISNILCIIVFCSNTFIKKPIAIYFICLLVSESITLLIGYIEMIDRESNMIDKSSFLCMFNEKIIHSIADLLYALMGRFCLEWMLYKVLWTRALTILLAILSIQRSRTFFSLSYRESRLCAVFGCIVSITLALTITCLEWTGVQYDKVNNQQIYLEIFQSIKENNSSREFYSTYLSRNVNESLSNYSCLINSFNIKSLSNVTKQTNCSLNEISSEFQSVTRSLITNRDMQLAEITSNLLTYPAQYEFSLVDKPLLRETIRIAQTPEILGRLFEKRSCHVTLKYSLWLRFYNFLHSVSFSWNRHIVAIFFGNALPSFIVVLANILSIKVIYFSKSLQYLKQVTRRNRRKRRLQYDLRAFLVILIESFSIILISWGIPILLTMYHCGTVYVVNISNCPKIKDYLALFLFSDLFNSSTNCLLYSLSGRLFRRKFIRIVKIIFMCGRGKLWHLKQRLPNSPHQTLDRLPSYNPSIATINNNFAKQSSLKPGNDRLSGRISSPVIANVNQPITCSFIDRKTACKRNNGQNLNASDDGSLSMSDDPYEEKNISSEIESNRPKKSVQVQSRKNSQSITTYLMGKVRSFGSGSSASGRMNSINYPSTVLSVDNIRRKPKEKLLNSVLSRRQLATNLSLSSSSITGSISHGSQRKCSPAHSRTSVKMRGVGRNSPLENLTVTGNKIPDNFTSL